MSYRADPNLIPGMGYLLMIIMIIIAFQFAPGNVALPVAGNADPGPPLPEEIVLRVYASGRMELSVDDEWGTTNGWTYTSPRTSGELERELRRHLGNRAENRVLTLKADSTVAFGWIDEVVLAARHAGVEVVRLVVEEAGPTAVTVR